MLALAVLMLLGLTLGVSTLGSEGLMPQVPIWVDSTLPSAV
jgi:hypothetical protein